MFSEPIKARFESFPLKGCPHLNAGAVIPTVKGVWGRKYGEHAYYFLNFRTATGLRIRIPHHRIIRPGWSRFRQAAEAVGKRIGLSRLLTGSFHYDFCLLEQLMLMTVPHTVTELGNGRFIINLWSWSGYLLIDTIRQTVTYQLLDEADAGSVLGSQQVFDPGTQSLYGMSFSLHDSLKRIADPHTPVAFTIFKHKPGTPDTKTIWEGALADSMHDLLLNVTRQYGVACELGMHRDAQGNIQPSQVLILDLKRKREWILDHFTVAAHACFDAEDPHVFYVSNHNFQFQHSRLDQLLRRGSYAVQFRGPASIYQYRLTDQGPKQCGLFTRDDFYRLTNMHAVLIRGRRMLVAMGFPDVVFLIDAETMRCTGKIQVRDPHSRKPALIGTIVPTPDSEKLLMQTTRSFQIVDMENGQAVYQRSHFFTHTCFNHMISFSATDGYGGRG